ncbi:MAG: Gfo/Idh/MocA family oxidoreductase [Oscillospiraceae bacterium]|nr:Gfo/Idh/MocA family oxidoreductase [Oscillospiraceae bacterium]
MSKLRVAIIGAGSIAKRHINALQANPQAEIACICDRNEARVQVMAGEFGLANYCTDYMDILRDESVDAVSILTPTFTHKDIVLAALNHGKHVLCEKPPALNVQEVQECVDAAARSGKLLMYAFVRRFNKVVTFLKDYIATGAMGDIYYAEVARMERCNKLAGWFVNKDCAGGGKLMDACVHQIDTALYLMDFPKVKSVKGYTSYANSHLPGVMKGCKSAWVSADKGSYERTVESMACGQVHFENGACLNIKASDILNVVDEGSYVELCGTKAGFKETGAEVRMVTVDESGYYMQSSPVLTAEKNGMMDEIAHFVDCCVNGTECICKPEHAVEVMRIITALYESAETGKEIVFG